MIEHPYQSLWMKRMHPKRVSAAQQIVGFSGEWMDKLFSEPNNYQDILPGPEVAVPWNQFVKDIVYHNASSNDYMHSNFQIISSPECSNIALPSQAKPFFKDAHCERKAVTEFCGSWASGFPSTSWPNNSKLLKYWNTQLLLPGKLWLEQTVCSSAATSNL